jgi:hypothetical protein
MKAWVSSLTVGGLLLIALVYGAAMVVAQGPVVGPNPLNGHYYEKIDAPQIPWEDANTAVSTTTRNGCQGYLATITSEQENQFVASQFGADEVISFWLGGFQDPGVEPADYGWQWVTGEPWVYTNWAPSEPNDAGGPGTEQHLTFWPDGTWPTWNDEAALGNIRGYIVEYDAGFCVQIDIKPGSHPNSINLGSKGKVPVAVLTTDILDASVVDPATVLFAGASPLRWAMEDVDLDGDLDLLFHFSTQELDLSGDSSEAVLTGVTLDGATILGIDTVRIVP